MEKISLQYEYNFPAMCNHCRVRCLSSSFLLGVPPLGEGGTLPFFVPGKCLTQENIWVRLGKKFFDEIVRKVVFYTVSFFDVFLLALQTVCQKNYCRNVKKGQKKLSVLS